MTKTPCHEAHITLNQADRKVAEDIAAQFGWVFSEISGCPILGQGTYCYLTGYDPDAIVLFSEMATIAAVCRGRGLTVHREKIERIVYDSKTQRNELIDPDVLRGAMA